MKYITYKNLTQAHQIFKITDWFKIYFCPSWNLNWCFNETMVINPRYVLDIAIIPFILIRIGIGYD